MTPPHRSRFETNGTRSLHASLRQSSSILDASVNGNAPRGGRPPRVLITGGAGFIGTNLAAKLAQCGFDVHVFDNLSRPGVENNLDWLCNSFDEQMTVDVADVRDSRAVRRAVARCDAVFHFAAQVAVTTSLVDPVTDFEINGLGTLHVLEACRRRATPPPLLFTSTNKVYGNLLNVPLAAEGDRYAPRDSRVRSSGVNEQQTLEFHSPYGCSKGTADQYVLDYARCWNLPVVVFRMSCIYGPHQCGNEDQGWVAHFVRNVLNDEPIVIYGDGRQVRDLLYVDDLIAAMVGAMENITHVCGRAFNIGGGPQNAASLREVLDLLGQLHGRKPKIRTAPWRQGDQRYYVSDTRSFKKCVGWHPRVGLQAGICRLYEWMQAHIPQMTAAV